MGYNGAPPLLFVGVELLCPELLFELLFELLLPELELVEPDELEPLASVLPFTESPAPASKLWLAEAELQS